jgi:hypothetical protein
VVLRGKAVCRATLDKICVRRLITNFSNFFILGPPDFPKMFYFDTRLTVTDYFITKFMHFFD